jgi:hypothetical protein
MFSYVNIIFPWLPCQFISWQGTAAAARYLFIRGPHHMTYFSLLTGNEANHAASDACK